MNKILNILTGIAVIVFLYFSYNVRQGNLLTDTATLKLDFANKYLDSTISLRTQIKNDILLNNENYIMSNHDFLMVNKYNIWNAVVHEQLLYLKIDKKLLNYYSNESRNSLIVFIILATVCIILQVIITQKE